MMILFWYSSLGWIKALSYEYLIVLFHSVLLKGLKSWEWLQLFSSSSSTCTNQMLNILLADFYVLIIFSSDLHYIINLFFCGVLALRLASLELQKVSLRDYFSSCCLVKCAVKCYLTPDMGLHTAATVCFSSYYLISYFAIKINFHLGLFP